MGKLIRLSLFFWTLGPQVAWGQGIHQGPNASVEFLLGQHFSGKITAPTFFPMLVFRGGYRISEDFNTRLGVSAAFAGVSGSSRESFNSSHLMVGDLSLGFIYSPRLGEDFVLELGGELGLWMSAMWGDNLLGGVGQIIDYLEAMSVSYGVLAGGQWSISDRLALIGELRFNLAMVAWAGDEYNTGGLTVLFGLAYRFRSTGP
jgi:hypothetical protein